jgi:hypothetical protein
MKSDYKFSYHSKMNNLDEIHLVVIVVVVNGAIRLLRFTKEKITLTNVVVNDEDISATKCENFQLFYD